MNKVYLNLDKINNEEIKRKLICEAQLIDYSRISMQSNRNTISPYPYIAKNEDEYNLLLSKRISKTDIIPYFLFKDSTFDNPLSAFKIENQYNAIFMGMSHSQCSIDVENLPLKFLMLSRPSMDLFCHLRYLQKFNDLGGETRKIKQIVLEVPYYIFNYDLSQFGDFVYTKLNYFREIGDYHNFVKKEGH